MFNRLKKDPRGVTLVELIISVALFVIIMVPISVGFMNTIKLTALSQEQIEVNAATRLVVNRVTEAIKDQDTELSVYGSTDKKSLFENGKFTGGDDFFGIPEFKQFKFKVKDSGIDNPITEDSKVKIKYSSVYGASQADLQLNGFDTKYFQVMIENGGTESIEISELSFRYLFLTGEHSLSDLVIMPNTTEWSGIKPPVGGIIPISPDKIMYDLKPIDSPIPGVADAYVDFKLSDEIPELKPGEIGYIFTRIQVPFKQFEKTSDDYSYNPNSSHDIDAMPYPDPPFNKVPTYYKGKLIHGENPGGIDLPPPNFSASYLHVVDLDIYDINDEIVQRVQIEVTE